MTKLKSMIWILLLKNTFKFKKESMIPLYIIYMEFIMLFSNKMNQIEIFLLEQ
jgi:hypothetical protein